MIQTILVVDDKLNVQKLVSDFLSSKGFEVFCASNGRDALMQLSRIKPDLILLDVMMPQMDGYQFIATLRETCDLPVIMITAKQHEQDIVKGFDLGVDDYLTKPFKMSELLARIKAVLKRTLMTYSRKSVIKIENLVLDTKSKEVSVDGNIVELTLAEIALLNLLMDSVGETVTKADICLHLIKQGYSGSESTLKIHIRNLRGKLEPFIKPKLAIESKFGVGYRLNRVEP